MRVKIPQPEEGEQIVLRKDGRREDAARETIGVDRINAFSDGVFAVAITLLILTIDVPQVEGGELANTLRALWPKFEGFLISFAVIGGFWISYHLLFGYIERHKPLLLWINMLFLFFIVSLPFSTELMSVYGGRTLSVAFYDLNMIGASLSLCLLWWYASYRNKLVQEDLDPVVRRHILFNYLSMSAIFGAALALSFVKASISTFLYFLLIPNGILLERLKRRRIRAGAEAEEPSQSS